MNINVVAGIASKALKEVNNINNDLSNNYYNISDVNNNHYNKNEIDNFLNGKIDIVSVPSTPTSSGLPGQISYDNDYLYICIAEDTWKRITLENWTN